MQIAQALARYAGELALAGEICTSEVACPDQCLRGINFPPSMRY